MKKRFTLIASFLLAAAICTAQEAESRILVGIGHSGISQKILNCFIKSVTDAGADYIVFETYPESDEVVKEYIDRVDALIIPGKGGNDTTGRSKYDNKLISEAHNQGKPVLGVCFGHQRINQTLGGKTVKVAEYYPGSNICHKKKVNGYNVLLYSEAHNIRIEKDSKMYAIFGSEDLMVNSSHFWSCYRIGEGLKVTATADDGVVEAIEGDKLLGVQFHPEVMYAELGNQRFLGIFKYIINEAAEAKAAREKAGE